MDSFPRAGHKCFVVVAPSYRGVANIITGSGVEIVTGHRFLGGFIGHSDDRQNFVMQKVLQ